MALAEVRGRHTHTHGDIQCAAVHTRSQTGVPQTGIEQTQRLADLLMEIQR